MRTATYLREVNPAARGDQKLYRLDPPMPMGEWSNADFAETTFVVVSAANVPYCGPETYIFAADADGNVTDWGALDGSFQGDMDHEEALRNAGYEVQS